MWTVLCDRPTAGQRTVTIVSVRFELQSVLVDGYRRRCLWSKFDSTGGLVRLHTAVSVAVCGAAGRPAWWEVLKSLHRWCRIVFHLLDRSRPLMRCRHLSHRREPSLPLDLWIISAVSLLTTCRTTCCMNCITGVTIYLRTVKLLIEAR